MSNTQFKDGDLVIGANNIAQVQSVLHKYNFIGKPLTVTRTDRHHFHTKELPNVMFTQLGFTLYTPNEEQSEQSRRQAIITEVTTACEVFEKYDIRRIRSVISGERTYHSGSPTTHIQHNSIAELCIHLSPCRLKAIQKLKAAIAEAQSELDSITGEGPCK